MNFLVGIAINVGVWLAKKAIENWVSRKAISGGKKVIEGGKVVVDTCEGIYCSIADRWRERRERMRDRIAQRKHRNRPE